MSIKVSVITLLQVAIIAFAGEVNAQKIGEVWQHNLNQFSTESGLSQSNVYKISKDSDGFIWIVSEDGLNRFDGYTFNIYKHDSEDSTSISDNTVWCITEDSKGVLWIGTNQGGLCRYNKEYGNFTSFLHDPADPNTISQNTVLEIFEASDGRLWIGTHWGLNVFDTETEKFIRIISEGNGPSGLLEGKINSILEVDNQMWIGTQSGISVFTINGEFIKNYFHGNTENVFAGSINNMILDENDDPWISADGGGLMHYLTDSKEFIPYENNPNDESTLGNHFIRSLLIDSRGRFWIGMDGYGFQVFDRENGKFKRALLNSNFEPDQVEKVYEIYEDDHDNLWFGSYGHGVFVLNNNSNNFTHYTRNYINKNSLSNNSVLAISEDDKGKIWLGTDGGGINIFNPEDQSFELITNDGNNPKSLAGNVVKSIYSDSRGNLWAGTYNHGLELRRKESNGFEHFTTGNSGLTHDNVWALLEDHNQNIWIGTLGGGINLYDSEKNTIKKYTIDLDKDETLSGVNISCLMEDDDGNIWVGTGGYGINVFNPMTNYSKRYKGSLEDEKMLSHNEIRFIMQAKNGSIWIATTHGLNQFNKESGIFKKYFEEDGLPSNVIKGIIEDDNGLLWISTNNGICRFSPETGQVIKYNMSDGLQGKEFNYNASIKTKDGFIYMGGINGFNRFHPEYIIDNNFEPEILFTKFSLFNKEIPLNEEGPLKNEINQVEHLEFEYDEYIFTLEFAANEYLFPKRNRYQYKLEGFDPSWNEVGYARSATYTNLPAGNYTFLVKATNNSGIWSSKVRKLSITVHPPWWHTRLAYVGFVILMILLVVGIVRLRTSYLHAQKIKLRRLVSKRTKQLEEKNERITMQAEELNAFNDTLNSVNENLEKKVIERTNELIIKNKKLSDYAFLNAHNLRAPVANIKGLLQLFEYDLPPEEKEDIIVKLKKQVEDVDSVLFDINQRLKQDSLIDPDEFENPMTQSQSSTSSTSSSSS